MSAWITSTLRFFSVAPVFQHNNQTNPGGRSKFSIVYMGFIIPIDFGIHYFGRLTVSKDFYIHSLSTYKQK